MLRLKEHVSRLDTIVNFAGPLKLNSNTGYKRDYTFSVPIFIC